MGSEMCIRDRGRSEGDRRPLTVDQPQQPIVAQVASSVATAAAAAESADVTDEATGDDTVIMMEYSAGNADISAPSNHDNDVEYQ